MGEMIKLKKMITCKFLFYLFLLHFKLLAVKENLYHPVSCNDTFFVSFAAWLKLDNLSGEKSQFPQA